MYKLPEFHFDIVQAKSHMKANWIIAGTLIALWNGESCEERFTGLQESRLAVL